MNTFAAGAAAALTITAAMAALPAHAADVNVSVGFSEPGAYGRVDVGRYPQPALVTQRPVIISRPGVAPPPPAYLWVPPAHRQNWRRYCGRYDACGTPVYFVRDDWYGRHVRPGRGGPGPGRDRDRDGIPGRQERRHP